MNTRQIAELREQIDRLAHGPRPTCEVVSSGFPPLDTLLPAAGLRRGTLVEWLAEAPGAGATTLAVTAAREVCGQASLVVVDSAGEFYPPAAARLGIDLRRMILVRPTTRDDELWAIDQTLRSRGVAAVLAWPGRCSASVLRRWQLAAEQSGSIGLLVRPARVRDEPCWAEARLLVATRATPPPYEQLDAPRWSRRLRVELVHGRGALAGRVAEWELNDETNPLPLAAVPRTVRRA